MLGGAGSGCETSKGPVVGDGTEVTRTTTPEVVEEAIDVAALVGAVERLRDQRFRVAPAVESTRGALPQSAAGVSEAVARDRSAIIRGLFGPDAVREIGELSTRHELATYDRDGHRVVYREGMQHKVGLRAGIVMALVEALEAERATPKQELSTWDELIAAHARQRGSGAFVAALDRLEQDGQSLDARALAMRPELALGLEGIGVWLEEAAPTSFVDFLEQGIRSFALREGLGLTAALYRTGGWSAVDYGLSEGVNQSGHVVRVDRWLAGEAGGQWSLAPEIEQTRRKVGYELSVQGQIGPAMTALWLTQVVDARSARSVYTGWRADQYRLWDKGGKLGGLFEWVSQWDTPHSAHQVAEAMGHVLQRRYPGSVESHVRVIREGLNVAVVISEAPTDGEVLENAARLLANSHVGYVVTDVRPLEFVSTLLDRYVGSTHGALLDESRWQDPAAGITMDLTPFKSWQVQKTDESGVRWFARHPDGALVQMTTELFSPLLPGFDSEGYVEHIGGVFAASVAGKVEKVERRDDAVGKGLELHVEGTIDGEPRRLVVWQWLRGDVLMTYSLQTTPGRLGARAQEARQAVDSLAAYADPVVSTAPEQAPEDDGILQFTVED
jgi:hypothetical protein